MDKEQLEALDDIRKSYRNIVNNASSLQAKFMLRENDPEWDNTAMDIMDINIVIAEFMHDSMRKLIKTDGNPRKILPVQKQIKKYFGV